MEKYFFLFGSVSVLNLYRVVVREVLSEDFETGEGDPLDKILLWTYE